MAPDERPAVDAGLLGGVLERLPARLRRRLDAEPALAEAWAWTVGGAVTVASPDAMVVLHAPDGVVREVADASCSCLLTPGCLHIAAVLVRLAPASGETMASGGPSGTEPAAAVGGPAVGPSADLLRAAEEMAGALGRLLDAGASTAGIVAVGDVLRAVHSCQAVGLHRAGAAGLRVAQGLARLRDGDPSFRLRELRLDIVDGMTAARLVAAGRADRAAVGMARRAYEPVSGLRLYGLFTEPVISRGGYAGCATYLVDGAGRLWVASDVQPAPPGRAVEAYGQAVGLGDAPLTHRQLSRAGALVAEGTASAGGRLGRGRDVRAVSAAGAAWWEAPVARLFDEPLEGQIDRVWEAAGQPEAERREGWSLVFARATLAGSAGGLLELRVDGRRLVAGSAEEHVELLYRENLGALAEAEGAAVMVVFRPQVDEPGRVALLAVGGAHVNGAAFPESWAGRASLGLDRVSRGDLVLGEPPTQVPARRRSPDVADPITRRLDRMVLGGRATLALAARRGVDRDIARLRDRHLATGAALLDATASTAASRGAAGDLAARWLALAVYESAVGRRLGVQRWLEG